MDKKAQKIDTAKRHWSKFCQALEQTGEKALDELHIESDIDLAEGLRYLSRIARLALESELENKDSDHPYFQRALGPTLKMGGDNPMGAYLAAPINGRDTYRINGNRGSAEWVSFFAQRSYDALSEGLSVFGDALFATNLECDSDGHFEIIISPEKHQGNWIESDKFSSLMLIRQFFGDWDDVRPMDLRIENLTSGDKPKVLLTLDEVTKRLDASGAFFEMMIPIMQSEMVGMAARTNGFETDIGNPTNDTGGVPGGNGVTGRWKLASDEALIVKLTPPSPCPYWDIQVGNGWYETWDYRHFFSGMTHSQAAKADDGSFTIILSEQDPGTTNWLQAAGHEEGHIAVRWQLTEGQLPIPECQVVKVAEVKSITSLLEISPGQRLAQKSLHREAVEQRFRL